MTDNPVIRLLREARAAEKEQALYYRALASQAEEAGDGVLSERLNGLHADEQHHLSRITARLIEMGEPLAELDATLPSRPALAGWEAAARPRELQEIARYESLLQREMDPHTRAVLEENLSTERHHAQELGGKWTPA